MPCPPVDEDTHLSRPKIAVLYNDASFSPLEIADAARDWCDLVWVLPQSEEPLRVQRRLLNKLGDVVEPTGTDVDGIVDLLGPLGLDGIITFVDVSQILCADIASHLGLRANQRLTAERLSDKFAQREALQSANVPVPRFASISPDATPADAGEIERAAGLPAVAKPRRGSGSRDTFLIEDTGDLLELLELERSEPFILEGFLEDRPSPGPMLGAHMVSVESAVVSGHVLNLMVTGRFPLDAPFRETGSFLPSDLNQDDTAQVLALATMAAEALGVTHGMLHTEIKMTPEGPRIIEVNGRIGGGIPRMMERIGGPDLLRVALKIAVGTQKEADLEGDAEPNAVAFFRWIHGPNRLLHLESVTGIDEVGQLPGVAEVRLNREPGGLVDPRDGGAGHVVAVEGMVASHEDLRDLLRDISSNLSIVFED